MARYQYRVIGAFDWVSSVGNALVAVENLAASGKRLTVRRLGLDVKKAGQGTQRDRLVAGRGNGGGGIVVAPAPHDSNSSVPTGLVVRANGAFEVTDPIQIGNSAPRVVADSLAFPPLSSHSQPGNRFRGVAQAHRGTGAPNTPARVRAGQSFGITLDNTYCGAPTSTSITIRVAGGTFTYTANTQAFGIGSALMWIENGSTETVEILCWGCTGVGNPAVSPYLQVVPFAGVPLESVDTSKPFIEPTKMDSAYPSPSSWVRVLADTPLTPSGAPLVYATEVGGGSPKGVNYLSTKDLLGPIYRAYFPEIGNAAVPDPIATGLPSTRDDLGFTNRHAETEMLLLGGDGIVVRPGEGLAVVPAAETFSGTTPSTSGVHTVYVDITFDVENLVQPFLVLNGVQAGSDIVVLEPGTDTVLASVDSLGGTTYSLAYDPDEFQDVDVCVYKAGYVPFTVRNLNLGAFGATVPVAQIVDRNFSNP